MSRCCASCGVRRSDTRRQHSVAIKGKPQSWRQVHATKNHPEMSPAFRSALVYGDEKKKKILFTKQIQTQSLFFFFCSSLSCLNKLESVASGSWTCAKKPNELSKCCSKSWHFGEHMCRSSTPVTFPSLPRKAQGLPWKSLGHRSPNTKV